jgi:hypothetical protein
MSDDLPDTEREALAALIDRTLAAEARTDAPPESERGDWLYGGVDPIAFTEPDAHDWMAIEPSTDRAWIPKALVYAARVVSCGVAIYGPVSRVERQRITALIRWKPHAIEAYDLSKQLPGAKETYWAIRSDPAW